MKFPIKYFAGPEGSKDEAGEAHILGIYGETIGTISRRITAKLMHNILPEKRRVVSHIIVKGRGRNRKTLDWVEFENDPVWTMQLSPDILYDEIQMFLELWGQPVC